MRKSEEGGFAERPVGARLDAEERARLSATSEDVMAVGEIHALIDQAHNANLRPVAIVLHYGYMGTYTVLCGLPVIRSDHAPRDRALIAWGRG